MVIFFPSSAAPLTTRLLLPLKLQLRRHSQKWSVCVAEDVASKCLDLLISHYCLHQHLLQLQVALEVSHSARKPFAGLWKQKAQVWIPLCLRISLELWSHFVFWQTRSCSKFRLIKNKFNLLFHLLTSLIKDSFGQNQVWHFLFGSSHPEHSCKMSLQLEFN